MKISIHRNIVAYNSKFEKDETEFCARIELTKEQWPILDKDDNWLNRPVRRWVYDNCSEVFFAGAGWILIYNEEDYLRFMLSWGGQPVESFYTLPDA